MTGISGEGAWYGSCRMSSAGRHITLICRPGSIFPMGNPMCLMAEYMYMGHMTAITAMFSVWEIMCAGLRLWRIWGTGAMRALSIRRRPIRSMQTGRCVCMRRILRWVRMADIICTMCSTMYLWCRWRSVIRRQGSLRSMGMCSIRTAPAWENGRGISRSLIRAC